MKLKKLLKILKINYFGYNYNEFDLNYIDKFEFNHNINTFHEDSLEILSKHIKINLWNKIKLKYGFIIHLDLKNFIIFELKSPTKTVLIINIDDIIYIYPIQQPRLIYCDKLVLINDDLKLKNKGYFFYRYQKDIINEYFESGSLYIIYKKKAYDLFEHHGYILGLDERNTNLGYKSIECKEAFILTRAFHPYLNRLLIGRYNINNYMTFYNRIMIQSANRRIIMLFI